MSLFITIIMLGYNLKYCQYHSSIVYHAEYGPNLLIYSQCMVWNDKVIKDRSVIRNILVFEDKDVSETVSDKWLAKVLGTISIEISQIR